MEETADTRVNTIPLETKIGKENASRRQIRGSSVFVVGRLLSLGTNFLTQILIVRYLAKSDYGAFAYALSLVTSIETIVTLGLDRAITRFIPIYDEQKDYSRLFGTIIFVVTLIASLSVGVILLFFGLKGFISQNLLLDAQAVSLLSVLIFLSPLQAFSNLINGMFAVFSSPKAIFFRRYVFGPGLKILVILLMIMAHQFVGFLAIGYTLSGLLLIILFTIWLYRIMKETRLFDHITFKEIKFPIKEVLSFTVPLLASDVLYMTTGTIGIVMLEHYQNIEAVAALGAVLPLARMNQVVLATFGLLYTPVASRLFARQDKEGINAFYWQNTVWTAVLSFPIFVMTFSFARPFTLLLFQERYVSSAAILGVLSIGYYFDAALGQNGLTLKVMNKLRYVTAIYLAAAVINVTLNLILVPRYGALGAAIATAGTLILFNLMKQGGLLLGTGISIFHPDYRGMYLSIIIGAGGLLLIQVFFTSSVVIFLLAAVVSLAVLRINRDLLNTKNTFPELMRFAPIRWLIGN